MAAGFALTPEQRRTLAAICDALVARLNEEEEERLVQRHPGADESHVRAYCRSSGSDLQLPEAVEQALAAKLPADKQAEMAALLNALSGRAGTLAFFGMLTPLADLPPADRQRHLAGLQHSRFGTKRKVFQMLKFLILTTAMSRDTRAVNPQNHGSDANSMWAALGFEGPAGWEEVEAAAAAAGRREHAYTMLNHTISRDAVLSFDAVIVGSGCGGSVVAAELAQAGKRVLVIEKARYLRREDVTGVESDATAGLYEGGGLVTTEDSSMAILAGSAFGGGSAVNWSCSLRTPDYVKQEWSAQFGLPAFTDGTFDAALDAVCSRVGVQSKGVAHNGANQLMIDGCRKLGYHVETAPQAMADVTHHAPGANFIGSGDRYGIKRSTPVTFLADAASAPVPAQFADQCYVEKILHEGGRARGVKARIVGANGVNQYQLVVKAPVVVVSCGSLHSPALLLRSGLPNKSGQIGKNLRLHPVAALGAAMPRDAPEVACWRGAPMTTVSNVVAEGPAGDGYGAKLEVPLAHPGVATSIFPYASAYAFKDMLLDYPRVLPLIVLTRDRGSGEVRIDQTGAPRLYYQLSDHDRKSLMDGLDKAARIAAAAGCDRLMTGHFSELHSLPEEPSARAAALEQFIAEMRRIGFPDFKVPMFSAHQMGTCRMGSDPASSVVKPTCESWECSGLYVVDASTFPTSSGTNPMITTYGIAYMAAQGLKGAMAAQPVAHSRL